MVCKFLKSKSKIVINTLLITKPKEEEFQDKYKNNKKNHLKIHICLKEYVQISKKDYLLLSDQKNLTFKNQKVIVFSGDRFFEVNDQCMVLNFLFFFNLFLFSSEEC